METGAVAQESAQQPRKLLTSARPKPTTERAMEGHNTTNRKDTGDPTRPPSQPAVKRKRANSSSGHNETVTNSSANWPSEQDEDDLATRPLKKQKTAPSAPLYADKAAMQDVTGDENETYAPEAESNTEDPQGEKIASSEAREGGGNAEANITGNDTNNSSKSKAPAKPKKSKVPAKPKEPYTDEQVKAFQNGMQSLNDWTSNTIETKYIDLIRWFNVDGLGISEKCQKWVDEGYAKKGKVSITEQMMYKHYNTYAPTFYAEKGLMWIPLERRPKHNKTVQDAPKDVGPPEKPRHMGTPLLGAAGFLHSPAAFSTPGFPDVFAGMSGNDLVVMNTQVSQTAEPQKKTRGRPPKAKAPETVPETDEAQKGTSQPQEKKRARKPAAKAPEPVREAEATRNARLLREQDKKLEQLLLNRSGPAKLSFSINSKSKTSATHSLEPETKVSTAEIDRFKIHRASKNVLSFKHVSGDVRREHPGRSILGREIAAQQSTVIRDMLRTDPNTDTIEYGDDIDESTVTRFIACISPSVRSSLPTHDVVELNSNDGREFVGTQIQWSMQELENLYMLAHCLGARDVCDKVVDRWYEELHRPTKRLLRTEDGETEAFDILGFGPAFLNYVCKHDEFIFDLFTDIIIMKGGEGLRTLKAFELDAWYQDVKLMLIAKLETGEIPAASKNDVDAICSTYHHHGVEHACYKSKVPFEPLVFDPELHEDIVSRPVIKAKKRAVASKHNQGHVDAQKPTSEAKQRKGGKYNPQDEERETRIQKNLQELYTDGEGDHVYSSDSDDSSEDEELNYITIELNSEYVKTHDLFKDTPIHFEHHTDAYTYVPPKPNIRRPVGTPTIVVDSKGRPLYRDESLNVGKNSEVLDIARRKRDVVQKKMQEFSNYGYSFKDIPLPEKYKSKSKSVNGAEQPGEEKGEMVGEEDVEMSDGEMDVDEQ